ncbi:type II secretion system F family protein [Kiloniella laminariae]|uniref:type II secretion system F family protein n=1 Tax=Kiloniella laminariae TaxID=454162 RepID=UPI000381C00A|nr:type II secretion system F family protein [Kiloniella laminariae]
MNLSDFIPAGFTEDEFIVLGATLSVLAIFLALWFSLIEKDPSSKKAKELSELRKAMRGDYLTPTQRKRGNENSSTYMKKVVEFFKLLKNEQASKYAFHLSQAGRRTPEALYRHLFFKLIAPLSSAALAYFYIYVVKAVDFPPLGNSFALISVTFIGAKIPDILLKNAIMKRRELVKKALPDALDLMVICTEAGLSLDAAFNRVAREMITAAPELSDELSLTSLELGFLQERQKALMNLALRIDIPMMRSLVNALIQAERYGTPLAQSLRVMSSELRQERLLKAEEKAARLPAIMTVPMIIFILPPLMIVLLGPAVMRTIDGLSGM